MLADLTDRVLDWFAPPIQISDVLVSNPLTDAEAGRDAWESGELPLDCPRCYPDGFETDIHDYVYDDTDSAPRPAPAGAAPAGTDSPSVSAGTLLTLIAQTLRDNDVRPYLIPAQLVAQAIHLNYRITPKK